MTALEGPDDLDLRTGPARPEARKVRMVTPSAWSSLKASLTAAESAWIAAQDFAPATGSSARLPGEDGGPGDMLIGGGDEHDPWAWAAFAETCPAGDWVPSDSGGRAVADAVLHAAVLGWSLARYRFVPQGRTHTPTRSRLIIGPDDRCSAAILEAAAVRWARHLIDRPANDAGPDGLEAAIAGLMRSVGAGVTVTTGEALLAADLPAIHAVGRAARQAPRLLDARWGPEDAPLLVLVGKGVSFDTGGLTIKSHAGMRHMKRDMGGAAVAAALAALIIAGGRPAGIRLRLLVPIVENVVGSDSFRPGDLLPTRSGKLIEIDNTDCEGRIILADCLTLAKEADPDLVVDCATLTGSARTALGGELQALFCPDDAIAEALVVAGRARHDPIWRMPLFDGYTSRIKGSVGDVVNMAPGAYAGAITAALFLREFIDPVTSWVHLDISAWNDAKKPGRPVGGEATGLRALHAFIEDRYAVA